MNNDRGGGGYGGVRGGGGHHDAEAAMEVFVVEVAVDVMIGKAEAVMIDANTLNRIFFARYQTKCVEFNNENSNLL